MLRAGPIPAMALEWLMKGFANSPVAILPAGSLRTMALALILSASLAGPANAAICARAAETESFGVRALQTRLMVAALSCNVHDRYNDFVSRYRPALAGHGQNLIRFFRRAYGPASSRRIDRYVTGLANQASMLSATDRPGFCAESDRVFDQLLTVPAVSLVGVTAMIAPLPDAAPNAPMCHALSRR